MSGLRLEGVSKRFGHTVALDDLTLEAREGSLLALLGPSGSGKSTALRVIAGLERPDAGRVSIAGRDVTGEPPERRGVAMVFQSFALFPHMSVEQNVLFGLVARREEPVERERRLAEVAERLDLGALLGRRPAELSGGERQRVALARALVGRPQVLLMDEPLSNLDAPLRARARAEVRRAVADFGVTTVYVTHDQSEALGLGDSVAVVRAGRLHQAGPAREVYRRPADTFVARFVGSPPMNVVEPALLGLEGEGLAGFRPEDAELGEGVAAELVDVEEAGHEIVWRLRVGDREVALRPGDGAPASRGDTVRFSVPPEAVRRFDRETGEAL